MEINNILWPTDISKRSAVALPMVLLLSQKLAAAVHLLYVVDDPRRFEHFHGQAAPDLLKGLQEAKYKYRSAESMMEQVCQKELTGCFLWHRHLRQGDPAARIIELALDLLADLIVMATHGVGRGRFPLLRLGGGKDRQDQPSAGVDHAQGLEAGMPPRLAFV